MLALSSLYHHFLLQTSLLQILNPIRHSLLCFLGIRWIDPIKKRTRTCMKLLLIVFCLNITKVWLRRRKLLVPSYLFIIEGIVCRNKMLRDRRLINFAKTLGCASHWERRWGLRWLTINLKILNIRSLSLSTCWCSIWSSKRSHITVIAVTAWSHLFVKVS